jgi:HPt (histidine-containing phosphotransfer) domain-containing protein
MLSAVSARTDTTADDVVLDATVIARYRARRASLADSLISAFLAEAPRYFQSMREAMAKGDLPEVKSNAHGLKSCSVNLGALRLVKVAQQTEAAAASGDARAVQDAFAKIGPTLFDTEEALKGERARNA